MNELTPDAFLDRVTKALPVDVERIGLDTRVEALPADKVSKAALWATLSALGGGCRGDAVGKMGVPSDSPSG